MVRPWEYGKWRRWVMQAVLWAGLGLSVLLAWWAGRTRGNALEVKLGPLQAFPNTVMDLNLRAPIGWSPEPFPRGSPPQLVLSEPGKRSGTHRFVLVEVRRVGRGGLPLPTPDEAVDLESSQRSKEVAKQKFDFLGSPGAMAIVGRGEDPDPDNPFAPSPQPAVFASAVLSKQRVAVTVAMTGPHAFAPADLDVVRAIAHGLELPDPNHPALPLRSPVMDGMEETSSIKADPRADVAEEDDAYKPLVEAMKESGGHPRMQGENVLILSRSPASFPDASSALWVSHRPGVWYMGTFGGASYRVPNSANPIDVCKACLSAGAAGGAVPESVVRRFGLKRLPAEAYERLFPPGTEPRPPGTPGEDEPE